MSPLICAVHGKRGERAVTLSENMPSADQPTAVMVPIVDPKRMLQPLERGNESRAHGAAGLGVAIVARLLSRGYALRDRRSP